MVDDGSSDDSHQIIQGYGGRIIPILKENGGQASALNAGFEVSHGEMVIFLDADDLLVPSMVKDVVDVFQTRQEIIRVQYRMAVIDQYGKRTGVEKPESHIPVPSGDVHMQALTFPFDMPWLPTSGNVFLAKALHQVMPIPEDRYGSAGADWYLVHLTSLIGPVFFLDSLEACYRVHSANIYEQGSNTLNLEHIRQTIRYCQITSDYLQKYAKKNGLVDQPTEILSVSDIANRLVSLRLSPEYHPITSDTRLRLLMMGAKAAFRRFDISNKLKILFLSWFIMMAIAPRPIGVILARWFLFPQQRGKLNQWLGKFHLQPNSDESGLKPYEDRE